MELRGTTVGGEGSSPGLYNAEPRAAGAIPSDLEIGPERREVAVRMKSVLVTGSSSGIGFATVQALSAHGCEVFASMRDPSRGEALVSAGTASAGPVHTVALDVTDQASVDAAVTQVLGRPGQPIDAVVHCAGLPGAGFFADQSPEELSATMETNFVGTARVTSALLPAMRAAGHGRIVVVSSVAAFTAMPGLSGYAASKWALEGWCESLAVELAPIGVEVVLVEPGTFRTAIWDKPLPTPDFEPYRSWGAALQSRSATLVKRFGQDPARAGERIAQIVLAPRPHFRNPLGADAWMLWGLGHLLPPRLRFRALSSLTRAPRRPTRPV